MMQWALGKFSKVIELWMMMQLSTLIVVYPLFYYWATNRPVGPASKYELWSLLLLIL
jgi:hypothetical protein